MASPGWQTGGGFHSRKGETIVSDQRPTPNVADLQGQIDALKAILLSVLDALADRKVDVLDAVKRRIPTGVSDYTLPGDQSGPARQRALNDIIEYISQIIISRSRG